MKRKFANRLDWLRILEREYKQIYLNDNSYCGHVTYLKLRKVKEPLFVTYHSKNLCIVDDGYTWMMHFPEGVDYAVTTTIDRSGKIVQWYFDIIKHQGLTNEGIPFIDDLYLDLVYLPDGTMFVLDEDELEEALKANEISMQEYDKAKVTLTELTESIRNNTNPEIKESKRHFELMNSL